VSHPDWVVCRRLSDIGVANMQRRNQAAESPHGQKRSDAPIRVRLRGVISPSWEALKARLVVGVAKCGVVEEPIGVSFDPKGMPPVSAIHGAVPERPDTANRVDRSPSWELLITWT